MTVKKRRFKRIYLVNREFQLRYTRLAVLVGLISTILTVVLILYPLFQFRILRFPGFLPPPFIAAIVVASVLNFGLVAWMGIIITNRIAGPMFALVRHLRRIQTGNFVGVIKVRADDEMKYLVRHLNDLVAFLGDITREDLGRAKSVSETLTSLRQGGGTEAERIRQIDAALVVLGEMQSTLEVRIATEQRPEPASETA